MAEEPSRRSPPQAALCRPALAIDSHRLLLAKRKAIIEALAEDPARARLLFANASLAFKDAGVTMSPGISNHVLHTIRQSKEAATRRERLTAELRAALGVVPHPSDQVWLAKTLFTKLKLTPLVTKGREPVYQPVISPEVVERLRTTLVPESRPRLPARQGTATTPQIPFRLDLDADIPVLNPAKRAPAKVTLPELWFYLDSHELVRPLLELGILEVSVMPTLTREQFEMVKAGGRTGGFLDWVEGVHFPEERIHPRKAAAAKKAPTVTKAVVTKATTRRPT